MGNKTFIAVLMGSDSDLSVMISTFEVLRKLKIEFEVKISSAHRTPVETQNYVQDAEQRGAVAFICAAGMAAHLAGAVAAHTTKPVIGVPINASMDGLDALMSTVQMPAGIPVATVAIGKAGAKNAAYLAAQIMAVADSELAVRLKQERQDNAKLVVSKDKALQEQLKRGEI